MTRIFHRIGLASLKSAVIGIVRNWSASRSNSVVDIGKVPETGCESVVESCQRNCTGSVVIEVFPACVGGREAREKPTQLVLDWPFRAISGTILIFMNAVG